MTKTKDHTDKANTRRTQEAVGAEKNHPSALPVKEKATSTLIKDYGIAPEIFKGLTGTKTESLAQDILYRTFVNPIVPGRDAAETIVPAMDDMKPQNIFEGMLCSQLLSLHCLGMSYLKRSENAERYPRRDQDLNNAVKLLRLQHETLEALMKMRRNGEQKVVVQHVYVNDGGKAVVGGMFAGGGGNTKTSEVPHGHSTNM